MNLQKLIFTKNACYKAGKKITPKGIMVHSTGANNPWLRRYVGPDDGKLGVNMYGNHWNAGGLSVCAHAFIGKLKDGTVATYQVLPWDHRGWHAGTGSKGKDASANNTHISFEICEDGLTDAGYFAKVYKEAVELCAHLCKLYSLTEKDIICHSEGCKQGIASNHGDVMHWFPKHGKSMDTFRADVKALLNPAPAQDPKKETTTKTCTVKLPILRKGDKGDYVKSLQRLLIGRGYNCGSYGADGDFGNATAKALRAYQTATGKTVDEIAGPASWGGLLSGK